MNNLQQELIELAKNVKEFTKNGGTKKIADLPKKDICQDREHNPPSHMVYKDGVYEHTCPSCGKTITFTVQNPTL